MSTAIQGNVEDSYSTHSHPTVAHAEDGDSGPIVESDTESPHLLSDEENEKLNSKIDLLLETLTSGRRVNFHPNPVTGEVEVTAGYQDHVSERKGDDIEADIAASRQNYGNITDRQQFIRSPNSVLVSRFSSDSSSNSADESQYEEALSASGEKSLHKEPQSFESSEGLMAFLQPQDDIKYGAPKQRNVEIHKALRQLEEMAGASRGSLLPVIGSREVQVDQVLPIPLDFSRVPRAKTPTIWSNEDELDRSSPLFIQSYERRKRKNDDWSEYASSDGTEMREETNDRVFKWLFEVEEFPISVVAGEIKAKSRAFNVLKDSHYDGSRSKNGQLIGQPGALKDVSNLRRPGYLEHNSFAIAKNKEALSKNREKDQARFGGAAGKDERLAYIEAKWPGFLQGQVDNDSGGKLKDILEKVDQEFPDYNEPSQSEEIKPATPKDISQDPERAAHFEKALARLEGRAPPSPSSPIRRYVYSGGIYGSDVEVDLRPVRCAQPRAIRYVSRRYNLAREFEKVVIGDGTGGKDRQSA